jgi:hypothetical protein
MSSLKFVKREYFDQDVIKALLNHNGLSYEIKQRLKKYNKKRHNGNCVEVVYDFAKDYANTKIGRIYVDKKIGLQGFEKDVRNALAKKNYFDVDTANAQCTILLKICKDRGWTCDTLQHYVENRDVVLKDIVGYYGCAKKDAKNLLLRMMFLGNAKAWENETNFGRARNIMIDIEKLPSKYKKCFETGEKYFNYTETNRFLNEHETGGTPLLWSLMRYLCTHENFDDLKLQGDLPIVQNMHDELKNIAQNVWGCYPEVATIVQKKRKPNDIQKLSSCLSLVLQTEEHKVLMDIDAKLTQLGRSMDTFIFDGGLVRKKENEDELPESVLRQCEEHVKQTLGYDIKLVVKPMETSLILNSDDGKRMIASNVIIDDVFAAKEFVKLMGDFIIYTDKELFVFDEEQGLWTNESVVIKQCINKFENELKFHQVDLDTGKEKVYNYSGTEKNMVNMLKNVPAFCVKNDFFGKYADTSKGKLLFQDGIYDFTTNTFTEGFDPKIVFKYKIDRPYPKQRNEELIKLVCKILFTDPFMEEDMPQSDYLRIGLSKALYGDYFDKKFYFAVGCSNAGKGVLTDALKATFQGFVGTFNAGALSFNENSGADAAKKLSWVFGIKDKRLAISNEVSMNKPFDGNMVKMLASGGDEFDARTNHKDETKVINRSTMFCFVNDIPTINPYDDGVGNRVRCIEYKCVFTNEEITKDFERVADPDIKATFKSNVDYQDALVHVMIDAYQDFLQKGHVIPNSIKEATKEWSGDAGSVEGLLKKKYEITRDANDYIPTRDLLNFLQKENKLTMSDKKIGTELSKLKLTRDTKTIMGKSTKVWYGIREAVINYTIDDDYD